ncbi:plasmid pRiA4b ORF-3 family protein [Bacillus coahuilensis]|uniref:plasmid pRiA4b ORF-3 family protein n=1 Tax=Bacillus coahuilensis TaxID=408580 RepID=UPI0001851324|nr:plasmid pRiA4b ORF-3 family protein [Bacillus coahuilensis]
MILQLKVTLKGMEPPVWRRLLIEDSMKFYEFHLVLQTPFEWLDMHLHEFSMVKTNGVQLFRSVDIAQNHPDAYTTFEYEEHKELVGDWFKDKWDKAIYTYDFGDNWQHIIVLERIVQKDPKRTYPNCVKAVTNAPREGSRIDGTGGQGLCPSKKGQSPCPLPLIA